MTEEQKNNPLPGVKLEALLNELVDEYGFSVLAKEININCFKSNPSIKSSLKFLRRTEWAREKVERFYLYHYKKLPKPSDDQYEIPPRKRTISKSTSSKPASSKPVPTEPKKNEAKKSNTAFNPWSNSKHNDN